MSVKPGSLSLGSQSERYSVIVKLFVNKDKDNYKDNVEINTLLIE